MKKVSELAPIQTTQLKVVCVTTTEMLATSPADPEVYLLRYETKAAAIKAKNGEKTPQEEHLEEELETLPDETVLSLLEKGTTVFHRDEKGFFMWAYQILGFLKAAGEALRLKSADGKAEKLSEASRGTKWGSIRSKIDQLVTVTPDRIYMMRPDAAGELKPITEADGLCTRPLRAKTAMGDRVSIARSEKVNPGVHLAFTITLVKGSVITESMLCEMLAMGERFGFLQWRNAGKGRFEAFIDAPEDWEPSKK